MSARSADMYAAVRPVAEVLGTDSNLDLTTEIPISGCKKTSHQLM